MAASACAGGRASGPADASASAPADAALAAAGDATTPREAAPPLGLESRPQNPSCRAPDSPAKLSPTLGETGCFDARDPRRPAPGLIPYSVNAALWSDGADKERWMALPDGARIEIQPDGDWAFPPGTVLLKAFSLGGRPVETRFFVRHADGQWSGWTYEWNDAGTDAVLLGEGSKLKVIGSQEWHFPSRAECDKCHTAAAGGALGLETAQLNREHRYPGGRRANQLATLAHIGLFAVAPSTPPERQPALPPPQDESAPLEARARAYLHANCAGCHRPELADTGTLDLRYATSLAETKGCDAEPRKGSLGLGADVRIIAPGAPAASMLLLRMRALDSARMPPFASNVVDAAGTALVEAWIRAIDRCP